MIDEPSRIDHSKLLQWLRDHARRIGPFHDRGRKILINSPWHDDHKFHCALLPARGKYGRFRDFKTERAGSVVEFVSLIEGTSWRDAAAKVCVSGLDLFATEVEPPIKDIVVHPPEPEEPPPAGMDFPPGLWRVDPDSDNPDVQVAVTWLQRRAIDPAKHELYVCLEDTQRKVFDKATKETKKQNLFGRIIVPYRNEDRQLVYWTARTIIPDERVRYLEPYTCEVIETKEQTLFCLDWNFGQRDLWLVEGWACATSLYDCGLYSAATGGAQLYDEQIQRIAAAHPRRIIMAYDRDEAGKIAALQSRRKMGCPDNLLVCFPPADCDWNKAFERHGRDGILAHISLNTVPFDDVYELKLLSTMSMEAQCSAKGIARRRFSERPAFGKTRFPRRRA